MCAHQISGRGWVMKKDCDVLDVPYGEVIIDKEDCVKYAGRFHIDDPRFAAGLILTREEYEAYRSSVYSIPLPR